MNQPKFPVANTNIVMDTRQCLEILELESVTSPEELKRAYRDMVKIWHPDRFHGDSRLEQIASIKLKKINHAYRHLLAYFDPDQSKRLKASGTNQSARPSNFSEKYTTEIYPGKQTGNFSNTNDDISSESSGQHGNFKIYSAPKKPFIQKFISFFVFCFLLAVSGLIVYFLLNIDKVTSKSLGWASEAMKKVTIDIEKDLGVKIEGISGTSNSSPSTQFDLPDQSKETRPTGPKIYFEIHLESGTVIMTESWWQQNNMIMYKQFGGSMGIEESRVKRIVESPATKSDLPF